MKNKWLKMAWGTLLITLFTLMLLTNIKGFYHNCFSAYDLGLYTQGIFDIAGLKSLNPYLTIRGLKALNDHFMPALYFAVPFAWIGGFNPIALIVFEWLCFATLIALVFKYKGYRLSGEFLISLSFIIFCKGFVTALNFPIHPGVWSIPLWFLLIKSIKDDHFKKVFLLSILIMTFRESFPFSIIGLSFWYLFKRQTRQSLLLLAPSVTFIAFTVWGRPYFLGETYDYGGEILKPIFNDTFNYVIYLFKQSKYNAFFKSFFPLIIPLFLIWKLEIKDRNHKISHPFFATLFLIAPLLLIHFIANKIDFQYSAPVLAPLISLFILSSVPRYLVKKRKLAIITIVLFILSSMSYYKRFARVLFGIQNPMCEVNEEKRRETDKLRDFVLTLPSDKTIFTSQKLTPSLMKPRIQIYTDHYFTKHLEAYDYFIFDKNYFKDWKESLEDMTTVENCQSASKILDLRYYSVWKGKLSIECIKSIY